MLLIALLIPATFVLSMLLRRHQLSLSDPYRNMYTLLSTAFLLTFFLLTIAGFVMLLVMGSTIALRVRVVSWCIVAVAGCYVSLAIVAMLLFVF